MLRRPNYDFSASSPCRSGSRSDRADAGHSAFARVAGFAAGRNKAWVRNDHARSVRRSGKREAHTGRGPQILAKERTSSCARVRHDVAPRFHGNWRYAAISHSALRARRFCPHQAGTLSRGLKSRRRLKACAVSAARALSHDSAAMQNNWLPRALLSACFAGLTAVFAKRGGGFIAAGIVLIAFRSG